MYFLAAQVQFQLIPDHKQESEYIKWFIIEESFERPHKLSMNAPMILSNNYAEYSTQKCTNQRSSVLFSTTAFLTCCRRMHPGTSFLFPLVFFLLPWHLNFISHDPNLIQFCVYPHLEDISTLTYPNTICWRPHFGHLSAILCFSSICRPLTPCSSLQPSIIWFTA